MDLLSEELCGEENVGRSCLAPPQSFKQETVAAIL